MFSVDKVRDVFYWPWPVQCVHRNKVSENRWFQIPHIFLHSSTFVLENPNCPSFLKELISLRIIQRNFIWIYVNIISLFNEFQSIFDNGQSPQTKEVHFQQSCTLRHRVIKLRDQNIGIFRCNGNRNKIGNILRCDNHPAGVNSRVSDTAFHFPCRIQNTIAAVFRVVQDSLHLIHQNFVLIL